MTKRARKKSPVKKRGGVQEPLVSEGHPSLFHYTNEAGLIGIINSNELWATHFAYLNDSQEAKAARGVLISVTADAVKRKMRPLCRERNIEFSKDFTFDDASEGEAARLIDAAYRTTFKTVSHFLFCFCSHAKDRSAHQDGLLSQWRAYGAGGGYAFEFDTKGLEEKVKEDGQRCSTTGYFLAMLSTERSRATFDSSKSI